MIRKRDMLRGVWTSISRRECIFNIMHVCPTSPLIVWLISINRCTDVFRDTAPHFDTPHAYIIEPTRETIPVRLHRRNIKTDDLEHNSSRVVTRWRVISRVAVVLAGKACQASTFTIALVPPALCICTWKDTDELLRPEWWLLLCR